MSSTGLDGVAQLVAGRPTTPLAKDQRIGLDVPGGAVTTAATATSAVAARALAPADAGASLAVEASAEPDGGWIESVVGVLVGFLFG